MRVCIVDSAGASMEDWPWAKTEREVKDAGWNVLGTLLREIPAGESLEKFSAGWEYEHGRLMVFRLQPVDYQVVVHPARPTDGPDYTIRNLFEVRDPIFQGADAAEFGPMTMAVPDLGPDRILGPKNPIDGLLRRLFGGLRAWR